MSLNELAEKFHDCARLAIAGGSIEQTVHLVSNLENLTAIEPLLKDLSDRAAGVKKTWKKKTGRKQ